MAIAARFNSVPAHGQTLHVKQIASRLVPDGYIECSPVSAAFFRSETWLSNAPALLPDLRSPLLSAQPGKYTNIYAPSVVETSAGYEVFYGGWDGLSAGHDHIYAVSTDFDFETFTNRRTVVRPGQYEHICNPNARLLADGTLIWVATAYPVEGLNRPAFFTAPNLAATRPPKTPKTSNLITMTGYALEKADINGMNVLLPTDDGFNLYFGDFRNPGIFRATSRNGRDYRFEHKVFAGRGLANDLQQLQNGRTNWWLLGLHENGSQLLYSLSRNSASFPPSKVLLTNNSTADRYIVSMGWVIRTSSPGIAVCGVLYGAGPDAGLARNSIFARWLQKQVVFVTDNGIQLRGNRARGPNRQLIPLERGQSLSGRFELYDETGKILVAKSSGCLIRSGEAYQLTPN